MAHSMVASHDALGITDPGAWLQAIVENSDDAIVSKTLDGRICSWNSGATKLYGYSADEMLGQPITTIIPSDRHAEEDEMMQRIRNGARVANFESVRLRKDGTLVDVSLTASPVRDSAGQLLGVSKIARDITALKREAERREILLQEVNHRVKNLFAMTIALVRMSACDATDVASYSKDITGRLIALDRAHQLTLPDMHTSLQEHPATLRSLIAAILAPHNTNTASKISIEGDDIDLPSSMLSALALILHEFATNATKYGALGALAGSLSVAVTLEAGSISLVWSESGAPVTVQDGRTGFGSRLVAASVAMLHGSVNYEWQVGGVTIRLAFPLTGVA